MLAAGEIVQIEDVLRDNTLHRSVRVTGRLESYNANKAMATITFQNSTIVVSTELLVNFEFVIGSLYQFIGETYSDEGKLQLRARVGRNVDGLDIQMFMDALKLRREFIKTTVAA
ncbi:unnamed protein product [Aphanomyces euteiches]|uniref:CST complex subunit TEN1 n=1 Tax=Aphanomyces euteiches TaxID=100861 RepID=A0A6G0XY99_9STRA|nr:hypothetical protein Ae201684_000015 [Aphanomyces euteiches]KAG9412928.1 hypothetical protein AC1031_015945 [Aphanomyces cochlioides]KAH9051728.1 hypothetical protein Ae201684P_015566 [Aphanomyces euteiches]KAH9113349.1 hypothetical protein AeMF1_012435 [Aphanomyces euteiches]KAH9134501.1 hypothetical protein LEN26_006785 [Aphanomyces euteiches]